MTAVDVRPLALFVEPEANAANHTPKSTNLRGGLSVLFSQRWTFRSTQTYSSVTCDNAHNTMQRNGQNDIQQQLLKQTSHVLSESGMSGCSNSQSLGAGYQPGTNTVSGRISMSQACQSSWQNQYNRVPQSFFLRIDGKCGWEDYYCNQHQRPWPDNSRYSNGGETVVCPVLLQYLG